MNTKAMLDTIGIILVIATFLLACVAHPLLNTQSLSTQVEAEANKLERLVSTYKEAKKANDEPGATINRNSILQERASEKLINRSEQKLANLMADAS